MIATLELMERKKKWNIFAHSSIADAFDALAESRGDKSALGSLACLLLLQVHPDRVKRLLYLVDRAASDARYHETSVKDELQRALLNSPEAEALRLLRAADDADKRRAGIDRARSRKSKPPGGKPDPGPAPPGPPTV